MIGKLPKRLLSSNQVEYKTIHRLGLRRENRKSYEDFAQ